MGFPVLYKDDLWVALPSISPRVPRLAEGVLDDELTDLGARVEL